MLSGPLNAEPPFAFLKCPAIGKASRGKVGKFGSYSGINSLQSYKGAYSLRH